MNISDDSDLLRKYAESRSEGAFAELVRRHVGFVYSTALRIVRDSHSAEDVTQGVFVALGQNAGAITRPGALPNWLHRTAHNLAVKVVRAEVRRRRREHEATLMSELSSSETQPVWEQIGPQLDAAIAGLRDTDRSVVLLRYFHRKSAREIAEILSLTEEAAQKRVSRAVEILRSHFAHRGIATSSSLLGSSLSAHAFQSAPAGLAAIVTAAALASASAAGTTGIITVANTLFMTKTQTSVLAALFILAATAPFVSQRRENARLREELVALRWENAAISTHQVQDITGASSSVRVQSAARTQPPELLNRSVTELVNEMATLLAKSKGENSRAIAAKWAEFLVQIPHNQLDQALLAALQLPGGDVRSGIILSLFHNWVEINPRAALAFATISFQGDEMSRFVGEALLNWSKQNPDEAYTAWREQSSDPTKLPRWGGNQHEIVRSLFEGMSQQDYQKALAYLDSIDREHFGSALAGLSSTAAKTEEGRNFFIQKLEQVTDPKVQERATRQFLSEWANRNDLPSAMTFVESLSTEKRSRYASEIGIACVRENSQTGADWWLAQTNNHDDRSRALFGITQEWARKDIGAAGEWLNGQGNGPETDSARMAYAEQVVSHDAETGMKWAQSISQPSLRNSTLVHTWHRWCQADPAAAERFLTQSGWSADLMQQARTKTDLP